MMILGELVATLGEGNKCSLVWKRSPDDGGMPIDYYQVERFDSEKNSWQACGRSKETNFEALGLLEGTFETVASL